MSNSARPKINFSGERQKSRETRSRQLSAARKDAIEKSTGIGRIKDSLKRDAEDLADRLKEAEGKTAIDRARDIAKFAKDPKGELTNAAKAKLEMAAKQAAWKAIDAATGGLSAVPGVHAVIEFIAGKAIHSKAVRWMIVAVIILYCLCCCLIFWFIMQGVNEINTLREDKSEVLKIAKESASNGDCRTLAGNTTLDLGLGFLDEIVTDGGIQSDESMEGCINFIACQRLEKRFQEELQRDFNCKAGGFLPTVSE